MAKIRIVGDSSGYVELAAPNAAGNNTLELPSNATKLVGADTNNTIIVGTGASIGSPETNVLTLATNNTEKVRIDSSGRLGIGTTNPTVVLQLIPTASISNVGTGIILPGTVGSALTAAQFFHNNGNSSFLRIKGTRNAAGSDWTTASTKLVNVIDVSEQSYIEYNPNGQTYGMAFGQSSTEWARFLSDGRLGIGITNPVNKLTIAGETDQFPQSFQIFSTAHATSRRAAISLGGTTGNTSPDWQILTDLNGNGTKNFGIYTGQIPGSPIRIDTSGRVNLDYHPTIELNGKSNADTDFTASAQLLTSTYYNQVLSRGGMSWNSTSGAITVPVTGYYFITGFFYCNTAGNGDGRLQIRTNGTNRVVHQMRGVGTNTFTLVFSLAANDTIDVIADGFDLPRLYMGDNHTRFSVFLLG